MWQEKIAQCYKKIFATDNLPLWLEQVAWQKVELHKKSRLCRVFYQKETSFSVAELQIMEQVFARLLPQGVGIAFEWQQVEKKLSRTEATNPAGKESVLAETLTALYEKKPKAKLWLLSCQYTWGKEPELKISFPSQAARDTCEKLGVGQFLADGLTEKLAMPVTVNLCYEQSLQSAIMAAAEKREEKIIASALTAQKVTKGYSGFIYGKYIYDSPIPIQSVFERDDFCVVRGEIITVTQSALKSGKEIYLLSIFDDTGYLQVKISVGKDKEFAPEYLTPGQWVKCRGKYGMDRFSGEVLFSAYDVEGVTNPIWGSDIADEKRVELCLHTKETPFCSLIPVEQGVYTAAKWGQHGIGVADKHSVASFPALWQACCQYGLKPIYGVELAIFRDETFLGDVVLWAKNLKGLAVLYEAVSKSLNHSAGQRDGVTIRWLTAMLQEDNHKEDVYCGLYSVNLSLDTWQTDWADWIDALLLTPVKTGEEQKRQKAMMQWALEQKINLIATDGASCYSLQQEDMVAFLRENSSNTQQSEIRVMTSSSDLERAFYYLGEDMAKRIVVDGPDLLYQQVEQFAPLSGQALSYPQEEDFWQTVTVYAKRKYDGVLPHEIGVCLEQEKELLQQKGYDWLYPILLRLQEKHRCFFVQDALLTTYVLGLSRENPLEHFIYCKDCGFSGKGNGFLCPNCGHGAQEFGMGTYPKIEDGETASLDLQKVSLCMLPQKKELIWQDLAALLKDYLVIAPGKYRRLTWENVEAMAEIFLSGKEREEMAGERQWFAATCQGILLGVEREENARFLIPGKEEAYQYTPILEREGEPFTYFPRDILSPHVLSVCYENSWYQQLFWQIYQMLPDYRQQECLQARDWANPKVWQLLKNGYWQGVPYLQQLAKGKGLVQITSVEEFARAVADCVANLEPANSTDLSELSDSAASAEQFHQSEQNEIAVAEENGEACPEKALQSVDHLLCQFAGEIGLAWDICWLKANCPEIFYTVVLNNLPDRSGFRDMWLGKTPFTGDLGLLLAEIKEQHIGILPLDVNQSAKKAFILTEQGILASLDSTTVWDEMLLDSLVLAREQEKFSSQSDFFQRLSVSPHLQHLFLTEHILEGLPEESQTSLF